MKINKYQTGNTVNLPNSEWNEVISEPATATAFKNRKQLDSTHNVELGLGTTGNDSFILKNDPKLRKQYLKTRNKHFKAWEPFYKQYAGTEYNQIWENFLNNWRRDDMRELVTPDSFVLQGLDEIPEDYFEKENNYFLNEVPDPWSRAGKKLTQYMDIYPLEGELVEDEKTVNRFIKHNVTKPIKSLARMHRTPKALIGRWLANRYAKKHGAPNWMLKYSPIENVTIENRPIIGSAYNFKTGLIELGVKNNRIENHDYWNPNMGPVIAHEAAHSRKLYNTKFDQELDENGNFVNPQPDSPYYNNNYSYINPKYKKLLSPTVEVENDHDSELSEQYSDLNALRMGLRNHKINRGFRLYTNNDIKRFLNTYDGQQDRYLRYHTNIKDVRKALNRIWKDGGKFEANSTNIGKDNVSKQGLLKIIS